MAKEFGPSDLPVDRNNRHRDIQPCADLLDQLRLAGAVRSDNGRALLLGNCVKNSGQAVFFHVVGLVDRRNARVRLVPRDIGNLEVEQRILCVDRAEDVAYLLHLDLVFDLVAQTLRALNRSADHGYGLR